MNLTLTFTTSVGDATGMESLDKKDLHKTWLTVYLLTGTNSDLHDMLRSNCHTSLSSGAKFLDVGRKIFEKGITVETDNGGKSALFNTKEIAILYNFVNWWQLIFSVS